MSVMPETPQQTGTALGEKTTLEATSAVQFNVVDYVEPVSIDEKESHQLKDAVNPLPDQTPTAVLGRRRFLGQNSLADPIFPSVTTWTFDPWSTLRVNSEVSKYLSCFKGFRADLRINVLCRAAPGTYGMYLVSWCYGTPQSTNLKDVMNWDTYVCDLATSESLEFVIPFRWPYEYRTTSFNDQNVAVNLQITNLMSKSVDSGSVRTDLAVYASFENIETGLYIQDNTVEFQSKMGMGDGLPISTSALGLGVLLKTATTMFEEPTSTLNVIGDNDSAVEAKKVVASSGKAKGVRQSFFGDLATLEPEVGMPSLDTLSHSPGLVSMNHMAMSGNMSFKDIGQLPGYLDHARFLSTNVTGTKFSVPIGLCSKSTLIGSTRWSTGWAAYYARFFRYYRGEHKIAMHFMCSPLVAARFSVHVDYIYSSDYEGAVIKQFPSMEMPSEVFMIKGSQTKVISIPWNQKQAWRATTDVMAIVTLDLIQPPTTYSADVTSVGVLITHSIDDLQFASIQHQYRTQWVAPTVEAQSNLRILHKDAPGERFGAKSHSRIKSYMHVIPTVKDLIRRWDDNFISGLPEPITSLDIVFPTTQQTFEDSALLIPAIQPFAFMTGTVENRLYFTGTGRPEAVVVNEMVNQSLRVGNGMSTTLVPAWPILEFTTPWLADAPVVSTAPDVIPEAQVKFTKVLVNYGGASLSKAVVRAGVDFQFFYPNALPNHLIWAEGVAT